MVDRGRARRHPRMTHNRPAHLPGAPPAMPRFEPATDAARRLLLAHLEARDYRPCVEAAAQLRVPAAAVGDEALYSLAAAAVAETFGLLDHERAAAARAALQRALAGGADAALAAASPDAVLAWCAAAGEWCEREGLDHEFSRLQPWAARADAAATPAWRVGWRIASAWHHESFGRTADVARLLHEAAGLADTDTRWSPVVALHLARLALARSDTARAQVEAERSLAGSGEAEAPLRHADAADVDARVALTRGDAHRALHSARRCGGLATAALAPPAYGVTFRLNEAYALVGLGAHADGAALMRTLAQIGQPRHLQDRLDLLACLLELHGELAAGRRPSREALHSAMRRLRELQWPGVLALLPQVPSRLWAEAIEAGIETDWVLASIRSRDLPPPATCWPHGWPWAVRLKVLGAFECEAIDGTVSSGTKAASRPLELLRRLALRGGFDGLSTEPLAEQMWPGEAREGRGKALEVTLARLRKLLGTADAVLLHDHRLRLNPRRVWLDRVAFEQALATLASPSGPADGERQSMWQETLALWRGPALEGEPAIEGLQAARDRLRARLAAALLADAGLPGHRARCLQAVAADAAVATWLGPAAG